MYGPSKASYGYTVRGWGLQRVYKGLQGVYKGYLDYLHLKLLLMGEPGVLEGSLKDKCALCPWS